MILNPWFWLGLVVWTAIVGGGGYLKGSKHAQDEARAAHATALEQTIKESRENAVIDMQAAVEAEQARQKDRVVFRDRVQTVERIVRENPTSCTLPAGIRLSINESIDAINSKTVAEYGKLPAAAKTGK